MYVSCYFFYYLSILLSSFQQTDPCDKDKGILADAKPTEVRPYCTQIHNQCFTGSSVGPIKKTHSKVLASFGVQQKNKYFFQDQSTNYSFEYSVIILSCKTELRRFDLY